MHKFSREDYEDLISNPAWTRIKELIKENMEQSVSILNDDKRDDQRFSARANLRAGKYLLSITEVIEKELEETNG